MSVLKRKLSDLRLPAFEFRSSLLTAAAGHCSHSIYASFDTDPELYRPDEVGNVIFFCCLLNIINRRCKKVSAW